MKFKSFKQEFNKIHNNTKKWHFKFNKNINLKKIVQNKKINQIKQIKQLKPKIIIKIFKRTKYKILSKWSSYLRLIIK